MGYSINTAQHHYIEWYTWDHTTGTKGEYVKSELYDRLNDPYEKINVAEIEEYGTITKSLSAQLSEGWRKAVPD